MSFIAVNLLDSIQAGEREDDSATGRDAATDISVSGAAGSDRQAMPRGKLDDSGNGFRRSRERDGVRKVGREPFVPGMLLAGFEVEANFVAGQGLEQPPKFLGGIHASGF